MGTERPQTPATKQFKGCTVVKSAMRAPAPISRTLNSTPDWFWSGARASQITTLFSGEGRQRQQQRGGLDAAIPRAAPGRHTHRHQARPTCPLPCEHHLPRQQDRREGRVAEGSRPRPGYVDANQPALVRDDSRRWPVRTRIMLERQHEGHHQGRRKGEYPGRTPTARAQTNDVLDELHRERYRGCRSSRAPGHSRTSVSRVFENYNWRPH